MIEGANNSLSMLSPDAKIGVLLRRVYESEEKSAVHERVRGLLTCSTASTLGS